MRAGCYFWSYYDVYGGVVSHRFPSLPTIESSYTVLRAQKTAPYMYSSFTLPTSDVNLPRSLLPSNSSVLSWFDIIPTVKVKLNVRVL